MIALLRMIGALLVVLGILCAAAWAVRRFDLRLPGRIGAVHDARRLQVVERLSLDPRRALVLVRDGEREHLLLLAPDHALRVASHRAAPATDPMPEGTPS